MKPQVHFIGNCLTCGYSLARLTQNRCPECGRPFDPADRSTMDFGRPWWAKAVLQYNLTVALIPAAAMWIFIFVAAAFTGRNRLLGTLTVAPALYTLLAACMAWGQHRMKRRLNQYARQRGSATPPQKN